jgi:hypothetical protein
MTLDIRGATDGERSTSGDLTLRTPSLWFWVKAGLGFGVGVVLVLAGTWLVSIVGFVSVLRAMLVAGR